MIAGGVSLDLDATIPLEDLFHMYEITVLWNGELRTVEADGTESIPLVGMAMLRGCDLSIRVVEGGPVAIQPIT